MKPRMRRRSDFVEPDEEMEWPKFVPPSNPNVYSDTRLVLYDAYNRKIERAAGFLPNYVRVE